MPSFGAQSSVASDSGSATQNVNHTAVGSNRYVLVYVFQWDDTAINALTYGGVSMGAALHRRVSGGTSRVLSVYGLAAPATGEQSVAVTFAANPTVSALLVVSYTDVHQSSAVTAVGSDFNDSTSPISLAIASAATDLVVAAGYMASTPISAGASQTARITLNSFADLGRSLMVSDKTGASPTQTMSYTCADTFEDNIILSVSLAAATAGSEATVSPTTGAISVAGRAPSVNTFTNVRIREVLVNAAGSPVGGRTGMHLLVWYGGAPSGAPDLSYSNMTTDANGTTSWSIATGDLIYNQHIFGVAHDGGASLSQYTCFRLIPTYS